MLGTRFISYGSGEKDLSLPVQQQLSLVYYACTLEDSFIVCSYSKYFACLDYTYVKDGSMSVTVYFTTLLYMGSQSAYL